MSCTTVKITRVGEIGAGAELASEKIHASASRTPFSARLSMVCRPSIRTPYLEISPEILWVYSDLEQYNDVLSNTFWHVN